MDRYITDYNPEDFTPEFLNSYDWDIIEFKATIDISLLEDYYDVLKTDLAHLEFHFGLKEYIKKEIFEMWTETNRVGNYEGNVSGWGISWPAERNIPCAGKRHVNPIHYPELEKYDLDADGDGFYADSKIMSVYKSGIVNKMIKEWGEPALRQLLAIKHPPGTRVHNHHDGSYKKLHIPMHSNDQALFCFGENDERKYVMKPGKIYMINPIVNHSTINNGTTERVHFLTRIDPEYVTTFAGITTHIK